MMTLSMLVSAKPPKSKPTLAKRMAELTLLVMVEVYEVYFIRCSDTLHAEGQCTFTHDNNLAIHNFKTIFRFFRLRESANLDDSLGSMIRVTCVVSPDVCTKHHTKKFDTN